MQNYREIRDALGRVESIATSLSGVQLLRNPKLNKGSAFTLEERQQFGLQGKLPEHIETMEQQVHRCYLQYRGKPSNIAKNVYLNQLKQTNEVLFYRLASEHIKEMLPIIYTPTIGEAVEKFSYQFNIPQGLYFSYPQRDKLREILQKRANHDIDLIIVTDGEGVLGIGDWGIGGMDICIGKLIVYTLCAGVNPRRVLPIQIDVGTNNESLLEEPMYLGWRHPRVTGKEYDDFIDEAVRAIQQEFPHVYLHWEDFGNHNAHRLLTRYRNQLCTFNDDIQGTGATALACIMSGLLATGSSLGEQRIVQFGAGTAGIGVVDQVYRAMRQQGISETDARQCFWLIDRPGLLVDDMNLTDFQRPYARNRQEVQSWQCAQPGQIDLYDVINNVKPTILIGCSTVHGAFDERIVKAMASYCQRPIILPLSNPTTLSEATPEELIHWTDGKVLTATGSPFADVIYKGKSIRVAQCNNAFIFPGLGLGIIACQASRVTDSMIAAAAQALADFSPAKQEKNGALLPDLHNVQQSSRHIALAVAEQAVSEGVATITDELPARIEAIFWQPRYLPFSTL